MTLDDLATAAPLRGNRGVIMSRLGSIAHLMTGSFAVAAVMALSTVVAARALGPEAYGILAIVLTIGRICERLIRFESWQPLIRFGTQRDIEENPEAMAQLFLLGLILDICCALLAAAVMLVGGFFVLPLVGLEQTDFYLLAIFAPAIALNISGVPTAALRLANQFRALAYFQLFSAVLRLMMAGAAWALGAPLEIFLAAWTIAQVFNTGVFAVLAARALKTLGVANPLQAGTKGLLLRFPGFMGFAWSTNASSALRTLTHEMDTLLVGAFAGPAAAGFYHIAKRFAKVAQQVAAHVQAVIYPDLSRMWARDRFQDVRSVKAKVQFALGAIGLSIIMVVAFLGPKGVEWLFGSGFELVYPLLLSQLVAVLLIMIGAPARSTLLAMNHPQLVLKIAVVATGAFFATALVLIPDVGAIGANYAHIAFAAITVVCLELAFRLSYRCGTMGEAGSA
ncbi:lipopolysaccharide biosynthesis protein [Erythrobacter sp.]|uniref:lipopolysaccharide biosynthesis protein n=1 Tax=Erythrobacter sp. TaxID=1042 RepID=UPI002ECD6807|nr:lipopolysaccharide biosynthesis protein [Erythrobacter sp.]